MLAIGRCFWRTSLQSSSSGGVPVAPKQDQVVSGKLEASGTVSCSLVARAASCEGAEAAN